MRKKANTLKKIGIVGAGLIGASLAKKLTSSGFEVICVGRNRKHLLKARTLGVCSEISTDLSDLSRCDIVVVSTPVDVIIEISKKIIPLMKKGAVITDVGSVKSNICARLSVFAKKCGVSFVGAHPMAGSEKSGCENARSDLFEKSSVFITPVKETNRNALKVVAEMWEKTGASCLITRPARHDRFAAVASHLPHLISFCFMEMFLDFEKKNGKAKEAAAGSFRDITRVAKSSPAVWNAIFKENRAFLSKNVKVFINKLENMMECLKSRKLTGRLNKIKTGYEKIENKIGKSR
ncbi:MAG: hypothetical protein COT16_01350 [Elusimicrobia bacterium CG08_land_8_20_14_0_20_44_26]|nr:MAG: hypothetical protein COT16_01350 [Elusimicrobia bacterium CG08_land_8_20_14_0_20_44_26]